MSTPFTEVLRARDGARCNGTRHRCTDCGLRQRNDRRHIRHRLRACISRLRIGIRQRFAERQRLDYRNNLEQTRLPEACLFGKPMRCGEEVRLETARGMERINFAIERLVAGAGLLAPYGTPAT